MNKRRTHSSEFKAKVAMEAISGRKTIQEIAANHGILLGVNYVGARLSNCRRTASTQSR
jgi:transposase-like protein